MSEQRDSKSDLNRAVDAILSGWTNESELKSRILWLLGQIQRQAEPVVITDLPELAGYQDKPGMIVPVSEPGDLSRRIHVSHRPRLLPERHVVTGMPRDDDDERRGELPSAPLFTCEICHQPIESNESAWMYDKEFAHDRCIAATRSA